MAQITEQEQFLVSAIQQGLAIVNVETGVVQGNDLACTFPNLELGMLRKKFIPNRRNLGLKGRFDWEIECLKSKTGPYQEPSLPVLRPYEIR